MEWPWDILEVILFWGSKVKVTRRINVHTVNAQYLLKGKAYEVQTWYTDGARRPLLATSAVTSKVKGEGRKVTWRVWQVLADKSRTKRPRNTKICLHMFQGQRSKVKVTWSITLHYFISNYNRVLFTHARWRYQYYNFTTAIHCHPLLARWRYCQEQHGVCSHSIDYKYILVSNYVHSPYTWSCRYE